MITLEDLYHLFPRTSKRKLQDFYRVYTEIAVPELELNTSERVACFIAQTAHESDEYRTMTEYASGKAYEGRRDLGNNFPGDGVKYKGVGYIQGTGRRNIELFNKSYHEKELRRYQAHYQESGLPPEDYEKNKPVIPDLVQRPELIGQIPELAMEITVWYWQLKNLNQYSDEGLFKTQTRRINGGLNGYAHRLAIHDKVYELLTTKSK